VLDRPGDAVAHAVVAVAGQDIGGGAVGDLEEAAEGVVRVRVVGTVVGHVAGGVVDEAGVGAAGDTLPPSATRPPSNATPTGAQRGGLGNPIRAFPEGLASAAKAIGFLLLGGWLLGEFASSIGLSKITGYLVLGLASSPYVGAAILGDDASWIISKDQQGYLLLVNDLAIALIALTAGGKIDLREVRDSFRAVSLILICEFGLVLIACAGLMTIMLSQNPLFSEYGGLMTAALVALVIGVVAAANSPAVVIAVLTETGANGPMARNALAVTVCKDLLLIIVFAVFLALATSAARDAIQAVPDDVAVTQLVESETAEEQTAEAAAPEAAAASAAEDTSSVLDAPDEDEKMPVWLKLLWQIGGSLVGGTILGVVLAWYLKHVDAHLPIVLTLGSFAIALISEQLGLKTLVVGLTAGIVIANRYADRKGGLFDAVQALSVPVYILFFAVAGTKFDPKLMGEVWYYVLALVALRTLSIWTGTKIGVKLSGMEPPASKWIWTAFVPQAGISLALAVIVADQFEGLGFSDKVYAILLSAIAIHELAGPILFKLGLKRAGEVLPSAGGR
jgi:Kef-type K+ transport system membrane component KefB